MTTQPTSQPGADHPLVTHADLPSLTQMRGETPMDSTSERARLLDRLIQAAEADKPALPEGWVLLSKNGSQFPYYYRDGLVYAAWPSNGHRIYALGDGDFQRDRLTPLVTAASLVPEGWHVDEDGERCLTLWSDRGDSPAARLRRGTMAYPHVFDVLAAVVTAAQAERGES